MQVTLEEYRRRLVERLRACRDSASARSALSEAELILTNSQLTSLTYDRFWEALEEELDVWAEEARLATDRVRSAALEAVVVAARARIARYRDRRAQENEGGDDEAAE